MITFVRLNAALVLVTPSSFLLASRMTPIILSSPVRTAQAKWDASEREALGVIMFTASATANRTRLPSFLWSKIRSLRRSAKADLRHEAWLEFLSIRKSSSESYTAYPILLDAAYVKIERITPENQTSVQCSEELSAFWSSI